MIEHKFKLGQMVRVKFNGQIEGVPVSVTKEAYVCCIKWCCLERESVPQILYALSENLENDKIGIGRLWDNVQESRLESLEPVVEAIANAAAA